MVQLTAAPAAGDTVTVESFDSGDVKNAVGSYTLTAGDLSGSGITVNLSPLPVGTGTGDIALTVSFDPGSGTNEITRAELSLYQSLADYKANATPYDGPVPYTFTGTNPETIPINYPGLTSGNYVVKIDFFRGATRVSRLVQTIIVRDGLTTDKWAESGSNTLTWNVFASSNAKLAASDGIKLDGTTVTDYAPLTYSYAESASVSGALPSSVALRVTQSEAGQVITASLNGDAAVTLTSGAASSLSPMLAANSIVITVTAPDGATIQTYTVGYTYVYEVYVAETGDDSSGGGTSASPFASVAKALAAISAVYNNGTGWPGGSSNPVPARIKISGTITATGSAPYYDYNNGMISVRGTTGTGLPPVILAGTDSATDKIQNSGARRVLYITDNATVILGDGLTLTGGNVSNGSGVMVTSGCSFTMNGGIISANGGGVAVGGGGTFIMSGGSINGNTVTGNGAGVYIGGSSFSMDAAALIDTGNDVYLPNSKKITIAGNLTAASPVAKITPQTYSTNTQVLDDGTSGTLVAANHGKFDVTPKSDGTNP
jgi:hypothetical protein